MSGTTESQESRPSGPESDAQPSHGVQQCDECEQTVEHWTIVKGWDLLCDSCMFHRLARSGASHV